MMTDSSILVGVSGGPDSLCLLDLLIRLEYPIIVATFNHLLRPQADLEVEAVHQFCMDRRVPFVTGHADVRQHANEHGLSIEESARQLRYDFLFQQARSFDAEAVAVGHTADDQVETILMHLLRGTGSAGLVGMRFRSLPNPWSATIPILRPLLSTWRNEIDQYIEQHNLPVSLDPSNQDRRYLRNRLRHDLIPELETYNPNVRKALWKTALVIADEQAVLERAVEAAWNECVLLEHSRAVQLEVAAFIQQPTAIQRALLRKALSKLVPGLRDVDFDAIERARQFIQSPTRSQMIDLIAGLRLYYEMAQVWIAHQTTELPTPDWPQLALSAREVLNVPGKLQISPVWELQASFLKLDRNIRQQVMANLDPYQVWLDPEHLIFPLVVRARRAGDRFQPLGFKAGSMKLSDFLINQKMPRRARDHWPLLCSEEAICWIPGFQCGNPFRVTQHTRQAVHITLRKSRP